MQAGGILNAFATRFAARDFVVLYSDILEAYGVDSGEIRFLLGHEIGHIRSKHILKNMILLPGLLLPLLAAPTIARAKARVTGTALSPVRTMPLPFGR